MGIRGSTFIAENLNSNCEEALVVVSCSLITSYCRDRIRENDYGHWQNKYGDQTVYKERVVIKESRQCEDECLYKQTNKKNDFCGKTIIHFTL